jgi:hypothetical protein
MQTKRLVHHFSLSFFFEPGDAQVFASVDVYDLLVNYQIIERFIVYNL